MGSYAETLLAPGEVVVHRSRQHWLSLVIESRLAVVLWAMTIGLLVVNVIINPGGAIGESLVVLMGITLVLGVVVVAWRWWIWRTQEYLITNRRLMNVSGVINKRAADSSLEKINDAILEENLVGRLLDYGDLDILTAADGGIDRYRMLDRAKEFKRQMLSAKHALETGVGYQDLATGDRRGGGAAGGAPTSAPSPAPAQPAPGPADRVDTAEEVTDALARLATLRDQGAITSGEYEVKKRELLGRL